MSEEKKYFKRVEPGRHIAKVDGREFELVRSTFKTAYMWNLNEITNGESRSVDSLVATIKEANKTLGFVLAVDALMELLGAEKRGKFSYKWTLPTRLGPLYVRPDGRAVFMCFEDVELARTELNRDLGFNSYSGKWNAHWTRGTSNDIMLEDLKHQLRRALDKETFLKAISA